MALWLTGDRDSGSIDSDIAHGGLHEEAVHETVTHQMRTLSLVTAGRISSEPANGGANLSDIRLKTNIEQVGVASNGLPLYHFRYFWSDAVYRGVMAQEVLEIFPEAVQTMPSGFMAVNYDALGMEMTRVH